MAAQLKSSVHGGEWSNGQGGFVLSPMPDIFDVSRYDLPADALLNAAALDGAPGGRTPLLAQLRDSIEKSRAEQEARKNRFDSLYDQAVRRNFSSPFAISRERSIRTCSVACGSGEPIRSGAPTSLTSPMAKGFPYLVVVMDWASRAALAWRRANTLGATFASRLWRKPWHSTAGPRSSTRTRVARLPVHQQRLYRRARTRRGHDQHGWQSPLHGQHLRRAAVAQPEI